MSEEFSGTLTERLQIMKWVGGQDATGAASGLWRNIGTRYAAVIPDGGQFPIERGGVQRSVRRWRVTMRNDATLTTADRLEWRGMVLTVLALETDPRAPALIIVRCESGAA
jgi:head-tail adaptor